MTQQKIIHSVYIKPLKHVFNERGGLLEIQNNLDEIYPGFGQVYLTTTLPGVIKAWYRHQSQIDQFIVLSGSMKLVLYDTRENLASYKLINEFIVNADSPTLIQIPSNIWHGFQALTNNKLQLLHLNSQPYNFDHPDEEKIPYTDHHQVPYQW